MTATATPLHTVPRIARGPEASALATAVYDQMLALLEALEDDEWARPTDCTGWTVHDVVAHLVGAAKGHARRAEMVRQLVHGRRHAAAFDGNDLDAMNADQVARHTHLPPAGLVAELRRLAPRAVRGRHRTPAPLRRARIPLSQSGSFTPGTPTSVSLGELMAVTLTRDVWLHRVDIARATGRPLDLDPGVDGRIVADIAAEWAALHGRPVRLHLTGPAGGRYQQGAGGPELELDAVEFARTLSGRADGDGLLATKVLF